MKKIYKTIFQVTVLSDEPFAIEDPSLKNIYDLGLTDGIVSTTCPLGDFPLKGKEAADACYELGSEPEFFQMDDRGMEID